MALFRNDSPGALSFEQGVRKAMWLEELQRKRDAAAVLRRQGRPVPPELEDETPPEDFSKPEEFKRFTNESPGALTLDQAVERHMAFLEKTRRRIATEQKAKVEARARAKKARMAEKLAAEGRGADSEVAHITPGEMVIPRVFQTPEVLAALAKVAAAQGVPLDRFRVGDARNRINPETGAPEFGFVDWIKGVPRQLFNAATPVQAYIAEPFESEKSTAVVLPPGGASMPPATAPSDTSLGYDPNGPGLFGAVKADPMGAAQALWHAGRAWQEARDRYEGGPAATTLYNGEGDAWKHARWNQRMVNAIGPERAKTFADFHERGPDNPVGERGMDLFNNQVGRTLEGDTSRMTIDELIRTGRLKTSPY